MLKKILKIRLFRNSKSILITVNLKDCLKMLHKNFIKKFILEYRNYQLIKIRLVKGVTKKHT